MSRYINIYKAELTEEEEQYLAQRNDLRLARQEAIEQGRLEELEKDADRQAAEAEEPEGVPVEEFVQRPDVTKDDLKRELDDLEVAYDPKATRPQLAELLVRTVRERSEG